MVKLASVNRAIGLGAGVVGVALTSGLGVASGQPDLGPLINTTCSYAQIVAALNAQAPDLAQALSDHPQAQTRLQTFLALSPDQRQQMVQQGLAAHPQWQGAIAQQAGTAQGQQVAGQLLQVANTCQSY